MASAQFGVECDWGAYTSHNMSGNPGQQIALDANIQGEPSDACAASRRLRLEMWINPGGGDNFSDENNDHIGHSIRRNGAYYGFHTGHVKQFYIHNYYGLESWASLFDGDLGWDGGDPPRLAELDEQALCVARGGVWDFWSGSCDSPLMIDIQNNAASYHLTSPENGVWFDLNANGIPERVAWTHKNSDVGFVVLDRNQNGFIDDGTELFGTSTLLRDGTRAANGFSALLDLDGGSSASDGKISETDSVFGELRLWIDSNHNGFSEPDELHTFADVGIAKLYTGYQETPRVDNNGNAYRFRGSATIVRRGVERERRMFDVFLRGLP